MTNEFCFGLRSKILAAIGDALQLFYNKRSGQKPIKKILLCNWSALGDLLLATSVVSVIKRHFPDCKIGFLVSKQSKVVLTTCEGIDQIHVAETWAGAEKSFFKKMGDFVRFSLSEKKRLIAEIAQESYDCSIELCPFFPNAIPIAWAADIPQRIGFDTSGNSRLLTHKVSWSEDRYLPSCYAELLAPLGISEKTFRPLLNIPSGSASPYVIFHICSSFAGKEQPPIFWQKLLTHFRAAGIPVLFTGKGKREQQLIRAIGVEEENNLCDKLDWLGLVTTIQKSAGIISVDSVPIHLAAALDVPFAVLYKNTPHPHIWFPNKKNGISFGLDRPAIDPSEVFESTKEWYAQVSSRS